MKLIPPTPRKKQLFYVAGQTSATGTSAQDFNAQEAADNTTTPSTNTTTTVIRDGQTVTITDNGQLQAGDYDPSTDKYYTGTVDGVVSWNSNPPSSATTSYQVQRDGQQVTITDPSQLQVGDLNEQTNKVVTDISSGVISWETPTNPANSAEQQALTDAGTTTTNQAQEAADTSNTTTPTTNTTASVTRDGQTVAITDNSQLEVGDYDPSTGKYYTGTADGVVSWNTNPPATIIMTPFGPEQTATVTATTQDQDFNAQEAADTSTTSYQVQRDGQLVAITDPSQLQVGDLNEQTNKVVTDISSGVISWETPANASNSAEEQAILAAGETSATGTSAQDFNAQEAADTSTVTSADTSSTPSKTGTFTLNEADSFQVATNSNIVWDDTTDTGTDGFGNTYHKINGTIVSDDQSNSAGIVEFVGAVPENNVPVTGTQINPDNYSVVTGINQQGTIGYYYQDKDGNVITDPVSIANIAKSKENSDLQKVMSNPDLSAILSDNQMHANVIWDGQNSRLDFFGTQDAVSNTISSLNDQTDDNTASSSNGVTLDFTYLQKWADSVNKDGISDNGQGSLIL